MCLVSIGPWVAQHAGTIAGETAQSCGITSHDATLGYVARHDGTRAHQGVAANGHTRQHDGTGTNAATVAQVYGTYLPLGIGLKPSVGSDRAWSLIVGDDHVWSDEDTVLDNCAMEDRAIVLDLDTIPDLHTKIDVDILAKDTFCADMGTFADLRAMPDTGARAN
jgi:hypothetical protein